jgi:hypothetical protein
MMRIYDLNPEYAPNFEIFLTTTECIIFICIFNKVWSKNISNLVYALLMHIPPPKEVETKKN